MKQERFLVLEGYEKVDPQLVGVFLEEGVKGPEDRVNPYEFKFVDGEPDFFCEKKTVLGAAEYQGLIKFRELAERGFKYVAWLSPPGGRSRYKEGRLVVAEAVEVRSDGEVEFYCRGIPLPECEPRELLLKGWRLIELGGETLGELETAEDLREVPIGINWKGDIWDLMEEVFGMEKVWEVIKQGKDVARKRRVEVDCKEVWNEMVISRGGRIHDWIVLGAEFERKMEERGFAVMAGGAHGMSNMALLSSRGLGTAFNFVYGEKTVKIDSKGDRLTWCELCGRWYKGKVCPFCS